ncbi:unnamed protein product [marine sediment metagenome]|uniref:Uncharacterized protein n=1 Tax=marine sediment metagenome TaxID=412755 RepID=X0XDT9_9ZZZZ
MLMNNLPPIKTDLVTECEYNKIVLDYEEWGSRCGIKTIKISNLILWFDKIIQDLESEYVEREKAKLRDNLIVMTIAMKITQLKKIRDVLKNEESE